MEATLDSNSKSLGTLLRQIGENARLLLQSELALARTEIVEAATKIGHNSLLLGSGGLLVVLCAFSFVAALIIGLGNYWDGRYWLSAAVVGLACGLLGALFVSMSLAKIKRELANVRATSTQEVRALSLALKGS